MAQSGQSSKGPRISIGEAFEHLVMGERQFTRSNADIRSVKKRRDIAMASQGR